MVVWQVREEYNIQENITRKAQPISYGGGGEMGTSVMWEDCLGSCGGSHCGTHSHDKCMEEISLHPYPPPPELL